MQAETKNRIRCSKRIYGYDGKMSTNIWSYSIITASSCFGVAWLLRNNSNHDVAVKLEFLLFLCSNFICT